VTTNPAPPPCAWCGEPSTGSREIEPAVKSKGLVVKPARRADVCDRHAAMVDREVRAGELRTMIRRDEAVARRSGTRESTQAAARARIERNRRELASLDPQAVA
jgi:hypothetical protein